MNVPPKPSTYFVTGTDTDAGKTLVTSGLLALASGQGLTTLGLKPIASGCQRTSDGLRNRDAQVLQAYSRPYPAYHTVNPYAFEPAIAPHLAARQAGETVSLDDLLTTLEQRPMASHELTLIEGAGGWRVPLNEEDDLADIARSLQLPVILVVGMRLGAINHARLTAEAIRADGLTLAGWVANSMALDFTERDANVDTLERHLATPCLGRIPYLGDDADDIELARRAANYLVLPGSD
ncbi:dethiobiotin synthase [Aidingimonas halophila]|uniref:ATP-dependent dethiobiotin synthetase BioD n=1 Tax=Aidingimonas halophila TaxID=574349 RepID=A0A1H3AU58_9GAMM|nr:dethiobiotin synthase [Aidingimonas halophila]GHC25376.1 ATP-dependent dethiobiotin synthetase BioD [Aidingimonas halophila]SDX33252.1 dethiobiotin synthetase [Aidingimonas halophila]